MEALTFNTAMLVSGIVLAVTFILIFTEQLHGYERSKVAAAGAVAMIIVGQVFGFYTPMEAVEAVDWNVIFLLAAMMTIVSIMIPTGGFAWMAYKIAAMSRGRLYLMLVMLGTAVTVLSLLLDNVTTVVIFGPLIILIAKAQKISPIPYLLAGRAAVGYRRHRDPGGRSAKHHDRLGGGHQFQHVRLSHGPHYPGVLGCGAGCP